MEFICSDPICYCHKIDGIIRKTQEISDDFEMYFEKKIPKEKTYKGRPYNEKVSCVVKLNDNLDFCSCLNSYPNYTPALTPSLSIISSPSPIPILIHIPTITPTPTRNQILTHMTLVTNLQNLGRMRYE